MSLGPGGIGLAFLAGIVSLLSPCVLPLLPLVLGGAWRTHRHGGIALAAGVVTAFVAIGLFVALLGAAIGLDRPWFRTFAAILLALFGIVLLSDALHQRLATAASPLSNIATAASAKLQPRGLGGLFVLGLALGATWSPCAGPTLGAASMLAAQGLDIPGVVLTLLAFAAGVTVPLILVGRLSHAAWSRWRGTLRHAGQVGEPLLGAMCVILAILTLTGADHWLQARLLAIAPEWLIDITLRY
jgi:cytochrome c-type biogenesis protein